MIIFKNKTFLKYIFIYVILTLIFFIFSYPYEIFVVSKLQTVLNTYNIPFYYTKIDSSPFKSSLYNTRLLSKKNVDFNNITISYSPLSLLTNSLSIKAKNRILRFNGNLKKNNLTYNIFFNLKSLKPANFTMEGIININGTIQLKEKKGVFNISSNPVKINIDKEVFNVGELKGSAALLDNQINIDSIISNGNLKVKADGKIFLNNNIELSSINIKCNITYNNNNNNIYIRGTLANPAFYTR
jgi:hypothetical protein